MSIVIPASQLQHTVVTIRCDSARTVPQIECSFDEDAPPGLSSHVDKGASFTFSDRKTPSTPGRPSSARTPKLNALGDRRTRSPVPTNGPGATMPRADLSIERGTDARGHFVRMSFAAAESSHSVTVPAAALGQVNGRQHSQSPRQPTPRTMSPQNSKALNHLARIDTGAYDQLSPSLVPNVS